jgi:hypothetical protein
VSAKAGDYRPRDAEHAVLYRVIAEHFGRVVLTLKTAWADGTRQLLFEPVTLLEGLAHRAQH